MKTRLLRQHRLTILATIAAVGAFAPALRADWGSLRSNNHAVVERGHVEAEHGRTVVEHGHVDVVRAHPGPARVVEPRHVDIEAERRQGFFWAGYHPGLTVGVLPVGCVQVSFGGTGYYYDDGVYFRPTPDGPYAVVAPPVGVIVPQVPDGAEETVAAGAIYWYAGGAFYLQQPTGFLVVPPPLGVTVHALPPGASPAVINGKLYYAAEGAYFLPVIWAGVTAYVVVNP